jgi:AcrR family transcriptional regulator
MPDDVQNPSDALDGWTRRRQRIARNIERTALELFAVHGPEEVTVEQIAEAAGISVRTFFRYFPSRDEIVLAAPTRQVEEMCGRVVARPAHESVLEAFIGGVHEGQELRGDDAVDEDLILLWGRAMLRGAVPTPDINTPTSGMAVAYAEVIGARLGILPEDPRAEVMATAIASVMWWAFLRWLDAGGARSLTSVVEESFSILRDLDQHGPSVNGAGPAASGAGSAG